VKYWEPYLCVPHKAHGFDLRGWNCWGAVRFILEQHAGIVLPFYDTSPAEVHRLATHACWHEVEIPQTFDVVCMPSPTRRGLWLSHVGIMVAPNRMLHCEEPFGTVCLPIDHQLIKDRIARGKIVRHESMLADCL
jgi:cell wall-associated NlpC family hydrolase